MDAPLIRPTFTVPMSMPRDRAVRRIREELVAREDLQGRWRGKGIWAEVYVPESERRLWSPYLSVRVDEGVDESVHAGGAAGNTAGDAAGNTAGDAAGNTAGDAARDMDGATATTAAGPTARDEVGDGCTVFGRFGPYPGVWTFFMFIYFGVAFLVVFGATFAYVQFVSDEAPWALWSIWLGVPILGFLHVASALGHRWGQEQMRELKSILDEVLEQAGSPSPDEPAT